MTKKILMISALALVAIAASPAHAISEKYRQQLERSGCTQVTDGNGCDIHKTKAQNQAAAYKAPAKEAPTLDKVDYSPYVGKWHITNEQGQALNDLVITRSGVTFGGDHVQLTTQHIADGALFISFNGLNFSLKKNGEGRWVSGESAGFAKH
ncbi:hypothetical protein KNC47_003809 [Salmonella enterica]|nr:hypothetical protein [Salmonella enterica]